MTWTRPLLVAEAALTLVAMQAALNLVPFPRLARRWGRFVTADEGRALRATPATREAALAAEVGWAVGRAARHLPLRLLCLSQALAARRMLERRRVASVLHFGVAHRPLRPFDAHAWVNAGGVKVIGYPVAAACVEIGRFV